MGSAAWLESFYLHRSNLQEITPNIRSICSKGSFELTETNVYFWPFAAVHAGRLSAIFTQLRQSPAGRFLPAMHTDLQKLPLQTTEQACETSQIFRTYGWES